MTKKSRQISKYLENEKSFQDEIKKHFSSFLKGFQGPNKKKKKLEAESPTLIEMEIYISTLCYLYFYIPVDKRP